MRSTEAATLEAILHDGVAAGVAPAMAAWVAVDGVHRATACAGEAHEGTVFDLASLTKPMVVVQEAMRDVAAGALQLEDEISLTSGQTRSVRSLLGHRSGLPAWDDLWKVATAQLGQWTPGSEEVWRAVEERCDHLLSEKPESSVVYSDLGFILLGRALERRRGRTLRELSSLYGPVQRAAPTGSCGRRGRELMGEVHDANCWVLGGAAGHAGSFGTVTDVGEWALDLARAAAGHGGTIDGGVIRDFWSRDNLAPGATWVLGWDMASPTGSSGGSHMSGEAIGHLGFTGTSVWIDPPVGLVVVLLTNRVAAQGESQARIRAFRPMFHDRIRESFALA